MGPYILQGISGGQACADVFTAKGLWINGYFAESPANALDLAIARHPDARVYGAVKDVRKVRKSLFSRTFRGFGLSLFIVLKRR